jgi:hypothetical protein
MSRAWTLRDKLAWINEHREAVDRPPIKTTEKREVARHLHRISKNAPYGNDPWATDWREKEPGFSPGDTVVAGQKACPKAPHYARETPHWRRGEIRAR